MPAEIHVVGAAIARENLVMVAQRGTAMSLAGQWEFPGGKVEDGEEPRTALARELVEELGIEVEVRDRIGRSTFTTREQTIVLDVYWCAIVAGEPEPREHSAVRWLTRPELVDLDWAAADIPIVAMICED